MTKKRMLQCGMVIMAKTDEGSLKRDGPVVINSQNTQGEVMAAMYAQIEV